MITLHSKQLTASFLETGELYQLTNGAIMVNQLHGNPLDGSITQLYLRVKTTNQTAVAPLIGSTANSVFHRFIDRCVWSGIFAGVTYQVTFQLGEENQWYWTVEFSGNGEEVTLFAGHDLGNALVGAVKANEAYVSQYVDHFVTKEDEHITITSRQNQPQNNQFPVVELGSFAPLVGYATDGYQFFGKTYKKTNKPEALQQEILPNEVYQYEFAYIALQTKAIKATAENQTVVFYGVAIANHPTAVTQPIASLTHVAQDYAWANEKKETDQIAQLTMVHTLGTPIVGRPFTEQELCERFPEQEQVEKVGNTTYSFFTKNNRHVVVQAKECEMERATGHILLGGLDLEVAHPVMSTTLYMYGIFNSQIVLGNTSMNKLLSNSRNALNVLKQSGQRIYLQEQEKWSLLTMPSAFEMGLNSGTWYYQLADDCLIVTTYSRRDSHEIITTIHSEQGKRYNFAVTNQFLMNADDEHPTYNQHVNGQKVTLTPTEESAIYAIYPELTYQLTLDKPFRLTNESLFGCLAEQPVLTTFVVENQSQLALSIKGRLHSSESLLLTESLTINEEEQAFGEAFDTLTNQFHLTHPQVDVTSMNQLIRWYTHNMLVHYLSPHGLEQYGGAAWGTRDVSQGPTEFFLAMNQYDVVESIITHIFENQFEDDGNWPQWFMFDGYEKQKADESHGDVIVWPMKVVTDYLEKSGNFSILKKKIPYTDRKTFAKTTQTATLFEHLKKEIHYIQTHFLKGTYLSCYGDGDWDDTLQPYDSRLKKNMASTWTVALTYQVINKLGKLLKPTDQSFATELLTLAQKIQADFNKYMLSAGTLPGFVYMDSPEKVEWMIHPTDQKTGIHYRLLPMTRSMIAELLSPEQMQEHLAIIKKQLFFPDGVRLMNRPAHYQGGVSVHFKRAEQAANFGREIGLQYVHAHIRFSEAMAKIGEKNETWKALNTINPIQLQTRVPNASLRQANAYFSSSDGDFPTRYAAQEQFDKLKTGAVNVKGGWRIYSSGPGIYVNQLISAILGIRAFHDRFVFDPVLPDELDGLRCAFQLNKTPVEIVFHLNQTERKVCLDGVELPFEEEANRYRPGGLVIQANAVHSRLHEGSRIDVYSQ